MANPNCYQRGNFVCWIGSINGKKNIRECVRAYDQNSLTCNSARNRFCRVHGIRMCPGGIRVCSNDQCPSGALTGGGTVLSTDGEVFINDEGQGLDALLDDLSGRDTTFVNMQKDTGVIRASDLQSIESAMEQEKGGLFSFDNKWFVPALALGLGVTVMFLTANRGRLKKFIPRRRR